MALQHTVGFQHFLTHPPPLKHKFLQHSPPSLSAAATTDLQFIDKPRKTNVLSSKMETFYFGIGYEGQAGGFRLVKLSASRVAEKLNSDNGEEKGGQASSSGSDGPEEENEGPLLMDDE